MNSTDYPLVCCNEFSASVANDIFYIKVSLGSVGIVLCLLAILIIGVTKKYRKDFVYRLLMYVMVVNSFQALCQVLHVIPVEVTSDDLLLIRNGTGWSDVCAAFGFLDMTTSWMSNLVIIWIMLYALNLNCGRIHHRQPVEKCKSHTGELVGICILFVSPFLFSWIPFVKDMYGVSGPWCWIKILSENGCYDDSNFQHLSLTFMVTMFYGPLFCISIFVVICTIASIFLLLKHRHTEPRLPFQRTKTVILFTYALFYFFFWIFPMVNRIYSFIHFNSSDRPAYYPLWIAHAVADSSCILVSALAVLFSSCCTCYYWYVLGQKADYSTVNKMPRQARSRSELILIGSRIPGHTRPIESNEVELHNVSECCNYSVVLFAAHKCTAFEEHVAKIGDENYGAENFPFLHNINNPGLPTQQGTPAVDVQPQQVQPAQNLPSGLHNSFAHMEENLPGCISSRDDFNMKIFV